ncbi:MAG: M48 family metallopeptidase [Pseudomonadota bacterium]
MSSASPAVDCLLFGPDLPPVGEAATVAVAGDGILLRRADGGASTRIDASLLTLRRVGFDERGLELAWRDLEHPDHPAYACHVLDRDCASHVLNALPEALRADQRELQRFDERQAVKRRAGLAGVALMIALPLLLLLAFVLHIDALVTVIVDRIPISQELALTRGFIEKFDADPKLRRTGNRHRVISVVLERLLEHDAAYDYTLYIANDPQINAYALPGGVIVVNDGLLDAAANVGEVAGVLAHEIQHVELRHGLRSVVKQSGLALVIALMAGDASGTLAGEVGQRLIGLRFSRDAERQADQTGFDRLVSVEADPAGMASFFDTLAREEGTGQAEFLSTHPASEQRAAALRARLDEVDRSAFRPFDIAGDWPPERAP